MIMESVNRNPQDQAIEFACAKRFHQSFRLPGTGKYGSIRVTYAVGGALEPTSPVLLWIGGMNGTRYQALDLDHLAKKAGLRVVFIDRYYPRVPSFTSLFGHHVARLANYILS